MINKSIAICLLLLFVGFISCGQKIDSLRELLAGKTNQERNALLSELALEYIPEDKEIALKLASEGYELSIRQHDSINIVRNGLAMGSALRRLQMMDSALSVYQVVRSIASINKYDKELAIALNSAGIAYTMMAHYDKALDLYFQPLDLRKVSRDTAAQIVVLINVGAVYYKLKDYQGALDVFTLCRNLLELTRSSEDADLVLLNMAHSYAYLDRFDDALRSAEEGVAVCQPNCSYERIMEANFVRGLVYFRLRQTDIAEGFFLKSYELSKQNNEVRFQLDNIDYLSQIYMQTKRFSTAVRYLKAGEQLLNNYPSFNLEGTKVISNFCKLYRTTGDYKQASNYQVKYVELKDRVFSEELTTRLMKVESEHTSKLDMERITAQNQLLSLNADLLNRQQLIIKLVLVLALLSIGFVILFFRNLQQKKRLNELLDRKIEERTHELKLSHERLLKAFEDQGMHNSRAAVVLNQAANRINGVCSIGLKEVADPVAQSCFERINSTTKQMVELLLTHFHQNEIAAQQ